MTQRIDYARLAPEPYKAMISLETYLRSCSIERPLFELMKVRASQINGCAFCIDMHWKDARSMGETEERLYMLDAWHESGLYSPRERAALAWTDAVTLISETHAPDELFEEVRANFSEKEIADLTWIVAAINMWNRIAISTRSEPGHYKPRAH